MPSDTMKAVIFQEPKVVTIEDRPRPKIQHPTDVVCKVQYTALCGRYRDTNGVPTWSKTQWCILTTNARCVASFTCFAGTSRALRASLWATSSLALLMKLGTR